MKKRLKGKIVSAKMKDTAIALVKRYFKHPKYGKYIIRTKRYKVHNKNNEYKVGEEVIIEESRPISKDKHFIIIGRVNETKIN